MTGQLLIWKNIFLYFAMSAVVSLDDMQKKISDGNSSGITRRSDNCKDYESEM